MELTALQRKEIKAGEIVVFRGKITPEPSPAPAAEQIYFYKLAIVVSISSEEIVLSPFTALWDEDDESLPEGSGLLRIPKSLPTRLLNESLAKPVLEVGDVLTHRGRPARITETKPGDFHLSLNYDDPSGGQFYGNLIWMDLSPTLDLLRDRAAWPPLA